MDCFRSVRKERSQDNAKDVDLGHWHFHFLAITRQRAGQGDVVGGGSSSVLHLLIFTCLLDIQKKMMSR